MFDYKQELDKFQPCAAIEEIETVLGDKELEEIKRNKTELYRINQVIKKYNQALTYAKQGDEDLAMLQLKNVVSIVPNFTDAYLLMTLMSLNAKDYQEAKENLNQILEYDPTNNSAVNFAHVLKDITKKEREAKQKTNGATKTTKKRKKKFKPGVIMDALAAKGPMITLIVGLVLGLVVSLVLGFPTIRASYNHKYKSEIGDYQEQVLAKDTQLKANEKKVSDAQKAQKKAEDELEEYTGNSKKDGIYDNLLNAMQKYTDRSYTDAAELLLKIDEKKLTTKSMKTIYKDLTSKVYPNASSGLLTKGRSAFYANDYKTAISYFKNVIKLGSSTSEVSAYYYMAQSYDQKGDKKNAKKYYQYVVDNFPGTQSAAGSRERLNEMDSTTQKNL